MMKGDFFITYIVCLFFSFFNGALVTTSPFCPRACFTPVPSHILLGH